MAISVEQRIALKTLSTMKIVQTNIQKIFCKIVRNTNANIQKWRNIWASDRWWKIMSTLSRHTGGPKPHTTHTQKKNQPKWMKKKTRIFSYTTVCITRFYYRIHKCKITHNPDNLFFLRIFFRVFFFLHRNGFSCIICCLQRKRWLLTDAWKLKLIAQTIAQYILYSRCWDMNRCKKIYIFRG